MVSMLTCTTVFAESKSDFYVVDEGSAVDSNYFKIINAYCNNINDVIVGGGCWGSDTMITYESSPFLGDSTSYGGYTCGIYDGVGGQRYGADPRKVDQLT
jgi:hypothetical protein